MTLVGRVTDVSDVHQEKAQAPNNGDDEKMIMIMIMIIMMIPIVVTLVGIVTDVNDVLSKAATSIC